MPCLLVLGVVGAVLDASATAGAVSGEQGVETTGGATARAFLGDPDSDLGGIGVVAKGGFRRLPELGERRYGTIAFELSGMWPKDQMPHFRGVVSTGWPMTIWVGRAWQDGVRRTIAGGESYAVRNCWAKGDDGESTCLSWFGGGGSDVRDETKSYGTVDITMLPLEALRVGPFRVDLRIGGGTVSESESMFHISALTWNVRARYHARDFVVEAATQRDPYAAASGVLAFEDRASLSTTWREGHTTWSTMVYASRVRWWIAPEADTNVVDTRGAELAVFHDIGPLTLAVRASTGRSFVDERDGARIGIELTARSGLSIPLPTKPEPSASASANRK